MKKKPTRKRRAGAKASVGYRIVRAWFDTVVNPLIRALQTEQVHLDKRDWTWRFQPPSLEMFRPVAGHVSAAARDNLEQFLDFHKEASEKAKEHDKQLAELLQACLHLHTAVFQSDRLRRLYTTLTSPDALKELAAKEPNLRLLLEQGQSPEAIRNRFFGGYPESEHLHVLAQYIVNHSPDLPSYFSTAPFGTNTKNRFGGSSMSRMVNLYTTGQSWLGRNF